MILADKILMLRKKNSWSQEELAEKLNVSRQSVSKWEGAIAIPDINKIIDMAKLFGVTTDYLLKDDIEDFVYSTDDDDNKIRKVSLTDANNYLNDTLSYRRFIALGIFLCVICPTILITFSVICEYSTISKALGVSLGLIFIFLCVATAIAIFIISDTKMKKYDFLQKENFELEYGVSSIVKEKKNGYLPKYNVCLILSIIFIILGVLPLVITAIFDCSSIVIILMVDLLLLIVGISVSVIVMISTKKGSYDLLLCEDDYNKYKKEANSKNSKLGGFYWPLVTATYLILSFLTSKWNLTWIIWPVAALVFAAISALIDNGQSK